MKSGLRSVSQEKSKSLGWLTGVLFLSDKSFYDVEKVRRWDRYFSQLIVAGKGAAPETLPGNVQWYEYGPDDGRAQVWNIITEQASNSWVLFATDDEQPHFSSFPDPEYLDKALWAPVLINVQQNSTMHQYYQMRLVNVSVSEEDIFRGFHLPDATDFVRSNDINLNSKPIVFERQSSMFTDVDIDQELSQADQAPKLYLVQGTRRLEEKQYVRAAAQFRQMLKKEKLLPFDRLAAVNGLASCLAEQHKWSKAISLAEKSLEAESLQGLPYLIQFRIHELRKQWQQGFDALRRYYDRLSLHSSASFDRLIDEEKTLINLANIALKAGDRSSATDYFDKLFTFKRGDADRGMLEKALLLSIELSNYKRSVYLFERLYGDSLPPNEMQEKHREKVDEVMTMFMKREWYEYVSGVYNELHKVYPDDREYKRKLIVTLTKTNRLDQAKQMVANIV